MTEFLLVGGFIVFAILMGVAIWAAMSADIDRE